jgi:hypothetical protein
MTADVYLQVLLVTLAGWVNRHQQHVIEYLIEENRVLKGQLKGRRLRLTDDQRRRLAAKGQRLGRPRGAERLNAASRDDMRAVHIRSVPVEPVQAKAATGLVRDVRGLGRRGRAGMARRSSSTDGSRCGRTERNRSRRPWHEFCTAYPSRKEAT